ncbi:MAG: rhomboid family intramembrane serine protease [Halobacteriovoraceae bacterium]|nr:rhomboid family intramembrane serine protease [Halobacteriovoraceae bacterium]
MQQLYLPSLTKTNKFIIITIVGVFLLSALFNTAGLGLVKLLALSADGVSHGLIFQLFTFPFVSNGLLEVIFNCLLIWLIGCQLESLWGPKRYIKFLMTTALGQGAIYLVISLLFGSPVLKTSAIMGTAGITNGLLLAYAILYPNQIFSFMLVIPVKAKYFCMIIIGIQLYMGFFSSAAAQSFGQLAAMGSAFLFLYFAAQASLKAKILEAKNTFKKKTRTKPNHLTLLDGGEDKNRPDKSDPKYWQ